MKTVTEHIREHILTNLGMAPIKRMPDLDELRRTEWSLEFENLMRNRLIMGGFRYGLFAEHQARGKNGYDNIGSAIQRLQEYQKTGNMEHLVDAANLCMKEFLVGDHPNKHWDAADDKNHTAKV